MAREGDEPSASLTRRTYGPRPLTGAVVHVLNQQGRQAPDWLARRNARRIQVMGAAEAAAKIADIFDTSGEGEHTVLDACLRIAAGVIAALLAPSAKPR